MTANKSLGTKRKQKFAVEDDIEVTKLQIDVAHQLVISGNLRDAAEATGVPYQTVRNWITGSEDFKKMVDKFTETVIVEMKAELVGYTREALDVERQIMLNQSNKARDRLTAAQDILDRAGLVSKKQQQLDINNNYNYFSNMPDEELDKILDVEFTVKEDTNGQAAEGKTCSSEDGEVKESIV